MKRAKSFIARVLLVFFCLASSAVSADPPSQSEIDTILARLNSIASNTGGSETALSDIEQLLSGPYGVLEYLNLISGNVTSGFSVIAGDTSSIATDVADIEYLLRHLNIPDYSARLLSIQNSVDSFYNRNHTDLNNLWWQNRDLMNLLSNRLSAISSQLSSVGRDVLAGNPWWATNSAFALVRSKYASAYPDDGMNTTGLYSFPQFLSKWSSFLSYPISGTSSDANTVDQNWFKYFGHLSDRTGRPLAFDQDTPYTWFHFVADAMRSNWVASASRDLTLHTSLSGISNVLENLSGGTDYLAGNPWWATNSGFVTDYYRMTRNGAYPPSAYPHDSFPVFFSQLAAAIYQPNISDYPYSSDYMTRWGRAGANWNNGVYTWYDWMADYLRSNLVLTTSVSATNLDQELLAAGYDTDTSDSITNTPLPQYSLPSSESMSDAEDALNQGETIVTDFVNSLPQPGTGGNPEIVLIPEFSVGGIHVPEYRASLNSPIVPTCHAVLSFLYAVGLACFVFKMAKAEYVYYASIGRQWGRYD